MSDKYNNLLRILKKGRRLAIPAGVLSDALGINTRSSTYVEVRTLVKEAILDGHPIGSCSKGFYIIADHKELWDVIASLEKRKKGLQNRIDALRRAYGRIQSTIGS